MHMAAMLVRATADHVLPIFPACNFSKGGNNVSGRSIGQSLKHLDNPLRSIADNQLHAHIRQREVCEASPKSTSPKTKTLCLTRCSEFCTHRATVAINAITSLTS